MMDTERRGEEESAPDSQDLSSAASLDRGNLNRYCFVFTVILYFKNHLLDSGSSNEESGPGRRQRRRRPRKVESETNGRSNSKHLSDNIDESMFVKVILFHYFSYD